MRVTVDDGRRQAHIATLLERFPAMVERLDWGAEQLAAHRNRELRALVAHARSHSAFHRERLRDLDPQTLTEADLASVPTMDKHDVMEHFDEIVTDRRITRELVEDHLESTTDLSYLFDEYVAMATGGTSGARTLVVWDWAGWADAFISMSRRSLVRGRGGGPVAMITADHPSHMSSLGQRTFSNPAFDMHRIPASLPIAESVRRLNDLQPDTLLGYASMIHRLALEAAAGRLCISPTKVFSGSEALLPETRVRVHEVWGVVVDNMYASSEAAGIAGSCGRGPWMHVNDDLHVVEIEPERVVITNLMNRALPLIRYVHDDRTELLDVACPCRSAHRVIGDVEGRADDTFCFGTTAVHPIVLSSALGTLRPIAEYQVRQEANALTIDVVVTEAIDTSQITLRVQRALGSAGADGVDVRVRVVDTIARHGTTTKLRRFIPDRSAR